MGTPAEQPEQVFVSWQTSAYDGQSHAITDEEFTFGPNRDRGHFEAVCGHYMCMGDSFKAPGSKCPRCVVFLDARRSLRPLEARMERRPSIVKRLCAMLGRKRGRHEARHQRIAHG